VGRQATTGGAAVARGGQEGLEPVADHGVEEGPLWLAPAIPRQRGDNAAP
jgi:hypothetical protein